MFEIIHHIEKKFLTQWPALTIDNIADLPGKLIHARIEMFAHAAGRLLCYLVEMLTYLFGKNPAGRRS